MEWLFALILGIGMPTGASLFAVRRTHRERAQLYERIASMAGLSDMRLEPGWLSTVATARSGELRLRFEAYKHGKDDAGTLVTIFGDSSLTLRLESFNTAFEKAFGMREIVIGDPAFDAAVCIQGPTETARAILDIPTRQLVRDVLERSESPPTVSQPSVAIVGGAIAGRFADCFAARIADGLPELFDIARRLAAPADIPGRLARNISNEPEWEARFEKLKLLIERYPRHPATRDALHLGCADSHEETQLRCALALGEEGHEVLREIATREWAEDRCAARAVAALGPKLERDDALTVLGHALRTRRLETARACMESLAARAEAGVVEVLTKVLAVEGDAMAIAAVEALGTSQRPEAEAPLLEALASRATDVRVAAAGALGHVGSAAAVLPLKEAADGTAFRIALRRAARHAVAEIQSRLAGAAAGQLSLSQDNAGRLSLADQDPRGQLSIADPPDSLRTSD